MNIEEIKNTYPANTVYLSYDKSGNINGAIPFDYYAERGKTYGDCIEAQKKERVEVTFKEVQSPEVYDVCRLYQKERKKAAIFDSVRFVIEDVIDSLQDLKDDIDEIAEE